MTHRHLVPRPVAALCALALVASLAACAAPGSASPTPPPTDRSTDPPPGGPEWLQEPPLAEPEEGPTYAGGTRAPHVIDGDLWWADAAKGEIVRIDVETLDEVARIPAGRPSNDIPDLLGIAEHDGLVWAGRNLTGGLVSIDPTGNEVVAEYPSDVKAYALISHEGLIWAIDFENSQVVAFDPTTGAVLRRGPVASPTGLAAAGGSIWVAEHRSTTVARIDPATAQVVERLEVGAGPENAISAFGYVWTALNSEIEGAVARIDPGSGEVRRVEFELPAYAVSASDDAIWATRSPRACNAPGQAVRIDPDRLEVTGWVEADCPFWALAVDGRVTVTNDVPGGSRLDRYDLGEG
jgi:streptogramin lyase